MIVALTGIGLSAAAGLNAYIPFVLVGFVARFTDVIELPQSYRWIESPWALGIASVLLATEVVLDKIPIVDTINDAVGTLVRPAMGGLIFAASQAAEQADAAAWMRRHEWVGIVAGVAVAGAMHTVKALARPAINLSTGGVGAPVVSTVEDASSFSLSLTAIFVPVLVIVALVLLVLGGFTLWRRIRRSRRLRHAVDPPAPPSPNLTAP